MGNHMNTSIYVHKQMSPFSYSLTHSDISHTQAAEKTFLCSLAIFVKSLFVNNKKGEWKKEKDGWHVGLLKLLQTLHNKKLRHVTFEKLRETAVTFHSL